MEPLLIDQKTMRALDFAPVAEFVAGYAVCSLGRESVLARTPAWGQPEEFEREQALVREVWSVYEDQAEPPLAGLFDAGPLLDRLGVPGSSLEPADCLKLGRFAALARPARSFAVGRTADQPLLCKLLSGVEPLPELEKSIKRVISEEGTVRDSASPELARVRAELRRQEGRLQSEINRLAKKFGASGHLQDNFHTIRGGRLCLPVLATRRSGVPGIVHGRSKTGETVFVEPMEVVEAANDLSELTAREMEEVLRVLIALADEIRPRLDDLANNLEIFRVLDDLRARARCAWENNWRLPRLIPAGEPLALERAHHPLLWIQDKEKSVPISATLRRKDKVLLLSGPNAGGKTTTLKLVGLLTIMAQAGFPLPCGEETALPVTPGVTVVVGDEQSVADGESTFSAHIRRLERVLAGAEPGCLALLDEIASGTDPTEGGALAIATIEELVRRGARVFCSSHLRQLMDWADGFAEARNASFRLDPDANRPTFQLTLDVPGHSNALRAAERFGFPRSVVERARELIPRERLEAAEMLETLHAKNNQADERLRTLQLQAEEMERSRADLERRIAELREEKRAYRDRLGAEKSRDIRKLRSDIERRIAELPAREALKAARDDVDEAARSAARDAKARAEEAPSAASEIKVGEEIYVAPLRGRAKVLRVDEDRGVVAVSMGGLDFELRVEQLSTTLAAPSYDADASDVDDFDIDRLMDGEPEPKPAPSKPSPAGAFNPLAAIIQRPGKGMFRRRQEEVKAQAAALKPKKSKGKAAPKKKFSEEEFFADTPLKTAKPVRTKPRPADEGVAATPSGGVFLRRADSSEGSRSASLTLDLHGQRVDDALKMVDDYLDNAVLSDWPSVRLMHGVGTGVLGRAIRAHIKNHPLIKRSYVGGPEEGGSGVTVVEFKE